MEQVENLLIRVELTDSLIESNFEFLLKLENWKLPKVNGISFIIKLQIMAAKHGMYSLKI